MFNSIQLTMKVFLLFCVLLHGFNAVQGACKLTSDCQHSPGQALVCLSSGKCLCNPGWTGPNAIYVNRNTPLHSTKLVADNCFDACNTVGQPSRCGSLFDSSNFCNGPSPEDQLAADGLIPKQPKSKCDAECTKYGAGKCSETIPGACECHYGWTGGNACYHDRLGRNKILAKDCVRPCFYNHDIRNPLCIQSN